MEYQDRIQEFSEARRNGFVTIKKLKDEGKKVIGVYCGFAPWEILAASGAVVAWLCGMDAEPIPDAEKHLPRNLCPLIKSSYGFALTEKCPYYYFADMLIGETTCDGKKKMYELLGKMKPMHVMNLPQTPNGKISEEAYKYELIRLKEAVEKELGVEITEEAIKENIKLRNSERKALRDFYELGKLCPPPITGYEMRRVLQGVKYIADKKKEVENINKLTQEIKESYEKNGSRISPNAKRILVTGSPLGDSTEKVIQIIEESGAVVVCFENCSSEKSKNDPVDEGVQNPFDALADRYLRLGCACMSPNIHRQDMIRTYIDEYKIHGVVDVILQACHTYNVETYSIKQCVNEKNIPYLNLETDYSTEDIGQLKTRIEAFIEML